VDFKQQSHAVVIATNVNIGRGFIQRKITKHFYCADCEFNDSIANNSVSSSFLNLSVPTVLLDHRNSTDVLAKARETNRLFCQREVNLANQYESLHYTSAYSTTF